jgi:hypothetical protein
MSASCPLYPQKQTLVECRAISALCQKETSHALFARQKMRDGASYGRKFQPRSSLNNLAAFVRPMRVRSASESSVLSNQAAAGAISS